MAKKKKFERVHEYTCNISGEKYVTTKEAPHPDELMSVKAYYQMHPEKDDRPVIIKKKLEIEEASRAQLESLLTSTEEKLS